ncbi:MAG: hypothetical protein B7Z55_15725, partial [Planctomycetales bacterium 12-60-4]
QTAPEFVELADDYLTLLQDEPRGVAYLVEAHRREPESTVVQNRFEQLGYTYDGVSWKKSSPMAQPTAASLNPAAPGQLAAGMSIVELTKMLGEPTSRTRIATAAGSDEFWVYGRAGEGSRLVIELRRSQPEDPYKVARFYNR